jgi:2-polyprenyl-3-methyl-5-hydroxy-6-metoxy-1,4-benzoquinol methylase
VRIGAKAENPLERIVMRLNLAPQPLLETQMAFTLARIVMAATKFGVFEALGGGASTAPSVAERCGTDAAATEKLLFALAAAGYVRADGDRYELTPMSRKWLLEDSPTSLVDKLLFQFDEWEWIERSEEYVRTGKQLEIHDSLTSDEWKTYQRGMRSLAGAFVPEAVRRAPMPRGARDLLDIGGSHGYLSVSLCRRYPQLRAVILDLPEAIEHAAPLLAKEGMGDRVVHRAGNALTDDLGVEAYDVVFTASLVHHLTDAENRDLAMRVARALRPGGVYAIFDAFRPRTPKDAGQFGALLEFYFALTSQSGTWTPDEMADWQREAGLEPRRPIRLRTAPGGGIQAATKPG